jgi:hypothetical protein
MEQDFSPDKMTIVTSRVMEMTNIAVLAGRGISGTCKKKVLVRVERFELPSHLAREELPHQEPTT